MPDKRIHLTRSPSPRNAVLFGAQSPISLAVAHALASAGASLFIVDSSEQHIRKLKEAVRSQNGKAKILGGTTPPGTTCDLVFDQCKKELGAPDVLVCAPSLPVALDLNDEPDTPKLSSLWMEIMLSFVIPTLGACSSAVNQMTESGGRIIVAIPKSKNISSAGHVAHGAGSILKRYIAEIGFPSRRQNIFFHLFEYGDDVDSRRPKDIKVVANTNTSDEAAAAVLFFLSDVNGCLSGARVALRSAEADTDELALPSSEYLLSLLKLFSNPPVDHWKFIPENDPQAFIADGTEPVANGEMTITDLYEAYCEWCEKKLREPLALTTFGKEIGALNLSKAKVGGRVRYVGIRLRQS